MNIGSKLKPNFVGRICTITKGTIKKRPREFPGSPWAESGGCLAQKCQLTLILYSTAAASWLPVKFCQTGTSASR